jgi:capsular exopolysaccharide synthesis family protein
LNSDVSVIDRAEVPMKPTAPRPVFSILLGVLVGVLGGIAGAFAMESFDDTINGTDETEALSRLPVLTAIPEFRYFKALRKLGTNGSSNGHGASYVETLISPKSLVSEGYRTLHNSIVFSSVDQPPRVLVFTSALPQEGKSTTCVNYAAVLAQKGAKVLLVDADLRRPSLAKRLGVTSSEGLGSLLLHQAATDLVFRPIEELPTLFFMPAGPVPTAPADALSSNRMKEILKMWSANYDHVIIDTPPILSVSDSLALAREADGVIMVIRAGRTPKRALLRSRDLLMRMQARIFGVVLNAVDVGVNGSYYNYSNSYGYGYSYGEDN